MRSNRAFQDVRSKFRLQRLKTQRNSAKMYNTIDQRVSIFDNNINTLLLTKQNDFHNYKVYNRHSPFKLMFNDINYESMDEYFNQKGKSIETNVKKIQKRYSTPYELLLNNIKAQINNLRFSNKKIHRTLLPFEKNQNKKINFKKMVKLKQEKNNFLNNYNDLKISPENNNNDNFKKPIKIIKFPKFKNKELCKLNNLKIFIENPNYISTENSNNNSKIKYQIHAKNKTMFVNRINKTNNYFFKPQYYYNYLNILKTDEKIKSLDSINSI